MPDDLATVRLVLATLRASGVGFDDAWPIAFPASRPDRQTVTLRDALDETRPSWQRAYVGEPATRSEQAAALLVGYAVDDPAGDAAEVLAVTLG